MKRKIRLVVFLLLGAFICFLGVSLLGEIPGEGRILHIILMGVACLVALSVMGLEVKDFIKGDLGDNNKEG